MQEQLLTYPALLVRMCALMSLDVEPESDPATAADAVIANVYRFGGQYEFVGGDSEVVASSATADAPAGASSSVVLKSSERLMYYYIMDELGSRFAEEAVPNFGTIHKCNCSSHPSCVDPPGM
jgi:hypothetical protein